MEEFDILYFMRRFYFPEESSKEAFGNVAYTYASARSNGLAPYDEAVGEIACRSRNFPGFKVVDDLHDSFYNTSLEKIVKKINKSKITSISFEPMHII